MAGRWRGRSAAAVRALTVAGAVLAAFPGSASAAGGTWGAGQYPYADGRVCRSGLQTSPLAAWVVDGGHRGYLTRSLTSDGRVDSGAPPIAAAGTPQPAVPVTAGAEFPSDHDVAAVAYLLDRGGDAAALAAAVLAETDPSNLPPCVATDTAYAALDQARRLAGPYQVTVAAPRGAARPGTPVIVSATVRTQAGDPVPGARVTFQAGDASVDAATVVTDSTGTARTGVRVRPGSPPGVMITASTSVPTGLFEATVSATPSVTNPSGAAVPAVYPAPATAFTGQATVTVDETAHPVVSTALGSRLVEANNAFQPTARVTGLNGHAADVTFELLGPKPLNGQSLCGGIPDAAWKSADVHVATNATANVVGDATVHGGGLTPTQAGCYALRTTVATSDATPAVVRTAPLVVVTVLDTTVDRADDQPAVASAANPGQLTGALRVGDTHGLGGTVSVTLVGPIRPADGNCAEDVPAWTKAPRRTVAATVRGVDTAATRVAAAGSYDYTFASPTGVGCYRAQPALTLAAPQGDRLTISAGDARAAYVLSPTITATVLQTWSITPKPVPVAVEVDGLYGLAAHVHVAMYVAAPNPDGCSRAAFTGAGRAGDGPDTEVPARPGIVDLTAQSGPTPKQGCYAAVPELTIDANPRVQLAGALGQPDTTLIAGADPSRRLAAAAQHGGGGTPLAFSIALSVLGGLLALAVARVLFVAWRDRDGDGGGYGWAAPRDVDRLGLTDDELPSPV